LKAHGQNEFASPRLVLFAPTIRDMGGFTRGSVYTSDPVFAIWLYVVLFSVRTVAVLPLALLLGSLLIRRLLRRNSRLRGFPIQTGVQHRSMDSA